MSIPINAQQYNTSTTAANKTASSSAYTSSGFSAKTTGDYSASDLLISVDINGSPTLSLDPSVESRVKDLTQHMKSATNPTQKAAYAKEIVGLGKAISELSGNMSSSPASFAGVSVRDVNALQGKVNASLGEANKVLADTKTASTAPSSTVPSDDPGKNVMRHVEESMTRAQGMYSRASELVNTNPEAATGLAKHMGKMVDSLNEQLSDVPANSQQQVQNDIKILQSYIKAIEQKIASEDVGHVEAETKASVTEATTQSTGTEKTSTVPENFKTKTLGINKNPKTGVSYRSKFQVKDSGYSAADVTGTVKLKTKPGADATEITVVRTGVYDRLNKLMADINTAKTPNAKLKAAIEMNSLCTAVKQATVDSPVQFAGGDFAKIKAFQEFSETIGGVAAKVPAEMTFNIAGNGRPDPSSPKSITYGGTTYNIEQKIGSGGAGGAFLVRNASTGETSVMKVMTHLNLPDGSASPLDTAAQQEVESQVLASQSGVNTPSIKGFACWDNPDMPGTGFNVVHMDLAQGSSITSLTQTAPKSGVFNALEPDKATSIMTDVFQSMANMHENNIAYLDLNPGNVMVDNLDTDNPDVSIIDFGVARTIEDGQTVDRTTVAETPYFSPSDVVDDKVANDIFGMDRYSAGVFAMSLATGKTGKQFEVDGAENNQSKLNLDALADFKNQIQSAPAEQQEELQALYDFSKACMTGEPNIPFEGHTFDSYVDAIREANAHVDTMETDTIDAHKGDTGIGWNSKFNLKTGGDYDISDITKKTISGTELTTGAFDRINTLIKTIKSPAATPAEQSDAAVELAGLSSTIQEAVSNSSDIKVPEKFANNINNLQKVQTFADNHIDPTYLREATVDFGAGVNAPTDYQGFLRAANSDGGCYPQTIEVGSKTLTAVQLLGKGQNQVVLYKNEATGEQTAIKIMPAQAGAVGDVFTGPISNEVKMQAAVASDSTLQTHSFSSVQMGSMGPIDFKLFFIEMDVANGVELADIVGDPYNPQEPVATDRAVSFAEQMFKAIQSANDNGVIVLDLKPSNFMCDDNDSLKLIDFGACKFESDIDETSPFPDGTPPFMRYTGDEKIATKEEAVDVYQKEQTYNFGVSLLNVLMGKTGTFDDSRTAKIKCEQANNSNLEVLGELATKIGNMPDGPERSSLLKMYDLCRTCLEQDDLAMSFKFDDKTFAAYFGN